MSFHLYLLLWLNIIMLNQLVFLECTQPDDDVLSELYIVELSMLVLYFKFHSLS